jgi:hypothetical protein
MHSSSSSSSSSLVQRLHGSVGSLIVLIQSIGNRRAAVVQAVGVQQQQLYSSSSSCVCVLHTHPFSTIT